MNLYYGGYINYMVMDIVQHSAIMISKRESYF